MSLEKWLLVVVCSSLMAQEENWEPFNSRLERERTEILPFFRKDDSNQSYIEHLTQLQLYAQENPPCSCYFPIRFSAAWDIRRFSYHIFEDLVYNKFGLDEYEYFQLYKFNNQINYKEDWFKYIYKIDDANLVCSRTYKRFYFALFRNAFFYSQYRTALLDLALCSESYPYNSSSGLLVNGYNATYSYLTDFRDQFFTLYTQCLSEHPHPKIYYERGMIHAHRGDWDQSIEDIRQAINLAALSPIDNTLSSELFLQEGSYYAEQGLYDQAILALTEAIAKNPLNKEAYFERANSYFESMKFDLAIKDYLTSDIRLSLVPDENIFSVDYAKGLTKGIRKGIQHEFAEAFPCWAPMMNMGLWALVNSPVPSAKFITATLGCVAAVGAALAADHVVIELKELVTNWDKLPQKERGELTGFLIGKYGVDIFAAYGSAKCMDAYQSLRKANNILTFELMLKGKDNQELIANKVTEQLLKRPQGKNIQVFNEARILKDKEKMKHLFSKKHQLEKLGEPKMVLKKVTDAVFHADGQGKIPQSGAFEIVVKVDEYSVNVRGAVVQGELRYGTIFIPE